MERSFYLDMAARGLRFPIGTHLTLHDKADCEVIKLNGVRLGDTVAEAARAFKSPVGIPLMDLALEKDALLGILGIPHEMREKYQFEDLPSKAAMAGVDTAPFISPRIQATCDAIRRVAENHSDIVPLGMGIGPFSLTTKLLKDPITPVFLAGTGLTGEDEPDVELLECAIDLSTRIIIRYLTEQAKAGAKAIIVCEPAANLVYFSPNQLAEGSDIFERFVLEPNLKVKACLEKLGVDLIFHDCGELTDDMVKSFNRLDPVILSLGCSRTLWNDAALVQKSTVLYGNLPSKKFYSDEACSVNEVIRMTQETMRNMRATGHPFIMGTECDVLSVPGREDTIKAKVNAMMTCAV